MATKEAEEQAKSEIDKKYKNMTSDEELEAKIDWIFDYFNHRDNIKGHADFVMYYSSLLLKEVLKYAYRKEQLASAYHLIGRYYQENQKYFYFKCRRY